MEEFKKILSHLLRSNKFKYPFIASSPKKPYKVCLEELLNEYVVKIGTLKTSGEITDWLKSNTNEIKFTKACLLSALDEYLGGSAGKANDKIEELMRNQFIRNNIIHLKVPLNTYYQQQNNSRSLYRLRYSDNFLSNRDEIFHIPFEKRYLVKNQRYSIAGIPCLYLGTSLYVCWQEMGKPDFSKLYLSYFKINKDNNYGEINVLNFAYSLETLRPTNIEHFFTLEISRSDRNKIKAFLAFWPILVACSFNSEYPNAHFTVEYVIPNLLLQWISKEKRPVSGIIYLSTKTAKLRHSDRGINLVFPPITKNKEEGFCDKLSNVFVWSKPISWQLLDTIQYGEQNSSIRISITDNLEHELIKHYKVTKFYEMENKLNNFAALGTTDNA